MPGYMASDIDRDRQTRNVGGIGLNGHTKAGRGTAEALRPDAQGIDRRKGVPFHFGIIRVGVRPVQGPAKRLFRQRRS